MRLKVIDSSGDTTILNVAYATFSGNCTYMSKNGKAPCEGLYIVDVTECEWVIVNLPKHLCEEVINSLLVQGYCDLSRTADYRMYAEETEE